VQPWKFRSCLASLNTVRSVNAGEANTTGIEARIGVAGAGGISRTDWASVEGAKSLMGQKGKGEALRINTRVGIGEDKWLSGLPGRDFTHDKRLFRCTRNSVLCLLVPFLLLLLSNNYKESEAYRASASSGTLPSINL
jgi:hypothetical protein